MAAGRAFFGPPRDDVVAGGAHITIYVVPVFRRGLIVFDIEDPQARGRWLPWDVLDFGQNPYEAASALADHWCDVPLDDLSLVDVMSFATAGEGWELAIVFRAELAEMPPGGRAGAPMRFDPGRYDAIGPFDPVDLERWVTRAAASPEATREGGLVF